ncbi:MAG: DNA/RNA nuclease SfsA [Clostridiales bacterium]|nr:DNA/RNA nuclease SfsA [Clostridiales bacterium]
MTYKNIQEGIFQRRPNRFIAEVEIGGQIETCHVKNTGRCKELLVPGVRVFVNKAASLSRKTQYDLVSVWKGSRLVNMDSQAPNLVFLEHLRQGEFIEGITHIKAEAKHGGSRFDFYVEAGARKAFIEVKGVTLEENDVAMFPDAPTERGVKHLSELAKCVAEGYEAYVVFVIQMKGIKHFTPNYKTHPEFGAALAAAMDAGVNAAAFDCVVSAGELTVDSRVPILCE